MSDSIRILGIDPGSRVTGFGLIELRGSLTRPVEWGGIRTNGEHFDRLRDIFEQLGALVERNGGADKEQVQHMIRLVLGIEGKLEADAADALAAAVCHAQVRMTNGLIARAVGGR